MRISKQIIRNREKEKLHTVNTEESSVLRERWQSDECMNAIASFLSRKAKLWWPARQPGASREALYRCSRVSAPEPNKARCALFQCLNTTCCDCIVLEPWWETNDVKRTWGTSVGSWSGAASALETWTAAARHTGTCCPAPCSGTRSPRCRPRPRVWKPPRRSAVRTASPTRSARTPTTSVWPRQGLRWVACSFSATWHRGVSRKEQDYQRVN